MKKMFPLAIALAAATMIPASALALDTGSTYDVRIINGKKAIDVGTWVITLDQFDAYSDGKGYDDDDYDPLEYEVCRYFVKWINDCELPSTANLYLDELMTPGNFDCEENSETGFSTLVFNSPGYKSRGFDKFNMKRTIHKLALGENDDGDLYGVVQFNGGVVYALEACSDGGGYANPDEDPSQGAEPKP